MTDTTTGPPAGTADTISERADKVYGYTARRVQELQKARDEPGARGSRAVALLAHLRRAAGSDPGTDPGVWDATLDGAPGSPTGGWISEPTREEHAIHLALTMYATAQQGVPEPAHVPGTGLGTAVRVLDRLRPGSTEGDRSPVRRRFDAMATATDLRELTVHLRGLITQMRGTAARLDYARFASDLFWYQVPGRAGAVRRSWARDYYNLRDDQPAATQTSDKEK